MIGKPTPLSDDVRAQIIALRREQNLSADKIAAIVHMRNKRVLDVLAEAGIGRTKDPTYLRRVAPTFDLAAAVRMFEAGDSMAVIGRRYGVDAKLIEHRINYAIVYGSGMPKPPKVERKCLSCGAMFDSEHVGHRRCDTCKRSTAWRSESTPALAGVRLRG